MAELKQKQKQVLSKVSSIFTLLERYPTLTTTDPMLTNFSINTSVGFLLSLLEVFGVTQAQIVKWLCKMLSDEDGENGLLIAIEQAVKAILMANIKNVFTCTVDPILPDNLMRYSIFKGERQNPCDIFPGDSNKPTCIEINLSAIDLFGLLANCPTSNDGSVFYFDVSGYTPSDVWKSTDFNAFLWYVVNKGNIGDAISQMHNTWDNRNYISKKLRKNSSLKNAFFSGDTTDSKYANIPNIPITSGADETEKKQFIICQYSEQGKTYSKILKVWLNADRYYRTRELKSKSSRDIKFKMNRTVFEFNYDYIYSLKLFDTKTLCANIINSLLGLTSSISYSFSLEMNLLKKKVENLVENIMIQDDTQSEDCYYKFDNTVYQNLINEVSKQYKGSYIDMTSRYNENRSDVFNSLHEIEGNATPEGQVESLKRTIQLTYNKMVSENNGITGGVEINTNSQVSFDFINDFIKQTVIQIVLQVLSPKVAILFAINSALLGDVAEIPEWENFINSFENVITKIIKEVKDLIIKALYDFAMDTLKPILQLLISKLVLETIKDYKELITNLITNCIPLIKFGGDGLNTTIDNVNYADIQNTGDIVNEAKPNNPCKI